jgi:hypothetical protein
MLLYVIDIDGFEMKKSRERKNGKTGKIYMAASSSSSSQHRLRVEATKKKTKNVIRLMFWGYFLYTPRRQRQQKRGERSGKNVYFKTVARQRKNFFSPSANFSSSRK